MNYKKLAIISIAFWIITLGFIGFRFIKGDTAPGEDGRTVIKLSPSEKSLILSEMRMMLQTVQEIVEALEQNNMKGVAEAALNGGTAMMVDLNPKVMMKLPLPFKKMGVETHRYYDEISEMAENGADKDKILSMMTTQLQRCNGCHAGYKFETE